MDSIYLLCPIIEALVPFFRVLKGHMNPFIGGTANFYVHKIFNHFMFIFFLVYLPELLETLEPDKFCRPKAFSAPVKSSNVIKW